VEIHRDERLSAVSPPREYLTITETADYLKVTTRTIREMIADGRLHAYRSGTRLVRLDRNEVDAHMGAA
jgi:excisionase family DNA binding protein